MFRKMECSAVGGYDETMRFGFEDWGTFDYWKKRGGVVIPEFFVIID
jgi:hypothetical protein